MSQINLDKYYDYVQYQEIVEYYFSYIQIIMCFSYIQIMYYFSFNYSYIRNNLHHNHSIKNHHVWML